jgi:hypothetical protein
MGGARFVAEPVGITSILALFVHACACTTQVVRTAVAVVLAHATFVQGLASVAAFVLRVAAAGGSARTDAAIRGGRRIGPGSCVLRGSAGGRHLGLSGRISFHGLTRVRRRWCGVILGWQIRRRGDLRSQRVVQLRARVDLGEDTCGEYHGSRHDGRACRRESFHCFRPLLVRGKLPRAIGKRNSTRLTCCSASPALTRQRR